MTVRTRQPGMVGGSTPARSRVRATLSWTAVVGAVATSTGLLGAVPGAAAADTPIQVVTITQAQLTAIRPLCPLAWSLVPQDPRLPAGVSRNVAVATCIRYVREGTRLTADASAPPAVGAPVPPGPDGQPVAPIAIQVVPTPPTPPVQRPVPVRAPVPAPVPASGSTRAPASMPASMPAPASGSGGTGGGSASGATPGSSVTPISSGGTGSGGSTDGTTTPPGGPSAAPAPGAAPGASNDGGADPALLAGSANGPVPVVGLPGTVSDPTTTTSAEATDGGDHGGLRAALVIGVILGAALLGLGLRQVVVHGRDLPQRVRAALPFPRRRPIGAPGHGDHDDPEADTVLSAGGFVHRWLSWGHDADATGTDATGIAATGADTTGGDTIGPGSPERPLVTLTTSRAGGSED